MDGFKILIVEDNASWQSILKTKVDEALGSNKKLIKTVFSRNDAVDLLNKNYGWDLLVVDIELPNSMTGKAVRGAGTKIVELGTELKLPIIVVSDTVTTDEVVEFLRTHNIVDCYGKSNFKRKKFKEKVKEILLGKENNWFQDIKKIREDLYINNQSIINNIHQSDRKAIIDKFINEHDHLDLVFNIKKGIIEVARKDNLDILNNIWNNVNSNLHENNIDVFQENICKLSKLYIEILGFNIQENLQSFGQVYGQKIDASNPAFKLNISSKFPVIYIHNTRFSEEDIWMISGLISKLNIHANYFALLIVFNHHHQMLNLVRESAYKNDFIVLDHDKIWDILAAKDPIKILTNYILTQIDLVTVSPYTVGGPVPEKMFFGRAEEEKTIIQNISFHNYAILANRKIGKTSLLNKLFLNLRNIEPYLVFYVDLQAVRDYESFYGELGTSYPENFGMKTDTLCKKLTCCFRKIVKNIKQNNNNRQIILIFDEVDEILNYDLKFNEQLFKAFRSLSQQDNVRFIFSGTTTIVKRFYHADSPFFNFCTKIDLKTLKTKAAKELVTIPMNNLGVQYEHEPEMIERIILISARHPNIIQYICDHLIHIINDKQNRIIEKQDLDMVIDSQEFYEYFESLVWGQSTPMQKFIVYLMGLSQKFTQLEVVEKFKQNNLASNLINSIEYNLNALESYSILSKQQNQYFFTYSEFGKMIESRFNIQDLIVKYQQAIIGY